MPLCHLWLLRAEERLIVGVESRSSWHVGGGNLLKTYMELYALKSENILTN